MQMCWQASPGNRASLRELRIMLLHLHSASRGDPDTASFDQKWNQLMPRHSLPKVEGPSTSNGNSSVCNERVDVVDIDLGMPNGSSSRPTGFESNFTEPNTSPDDIWPPVTSGPVSANSALPSNSIARSPLNEMSLAAELGELGTSEAGHDDDDDNTKVGNSHAAAHINVFAEVHTEKSDAQQADSLNVPLSESMDVTDPFSLLNVETFDDSAMSQAEKYASYLQTVNTSVIEADDNAAEDAKSKDLQPSEPVQSSDPDSTADAIGNSP